MQRQPDAEHSAATRAAVEFDAAVVGAHHALHDHQAQARAFFLRRVKRFKDALQMFIRNAATCVANADPDPVGTFPGGERQRATFGHGLHRVLQD